METMERIDKGYEYIIQVICTSNNTTYTSKQPTHFQQSQNGMHWFLHFLMQQQGSPWFHFPGDRIQKQAKCVIYFCYELLLMFKSVVHRTSAYPQHRHELQCKIDNMHVGAHRTCSKERRLQIYKSSQP